MTAGRRMASESPFLKLAKNEDLREVHFLQFARRWMKTPMGECPHAQAQMKTGPTLMTERTPCKRHSALSSLIAGFSYEKRTITQSLPPISRMTITISRGALPHLAWHAAVPIAR